MSNTNDQTARVYDGRYRGKTMLIVGSGRDLDGRGLGELIDSDTYDVVVRVNKHYGDPKDVGNRTDVIITRWNGWLDNEDWFGREEQEQAKEIVVLNQHIGVSATEYEWVCRQVGHGAISAGCQAVAWGLLRGVARIDAIGFGRKDGRPSEAKQYSGATPALVP